MKRLLDMVLLLSLLCGYISFILPEVEASEGASSYTLVKNDGDRHINLSRLDNDIRIVRPGRSTKRPVQNIPGTGNCCAAMPAVFRFRNHNTAYAGGRCPRIYNRHIQVRAGPFRN